MSRFSSLVAATFAINSCGATLYHAEQGRYVGIYDEDNTYSWSQALLHCERVYGTSLASVHTKSDENDVNDARYNNDVGTWIGLTDQEIEGQWQWVDGSMYDLNVTWGAGEPNNFNGGEDCVQVVTVYPEQSDNVNVTGVMYFNDVPCSWETHQFICNAKDLLDNSNEDTSDEITLKIVEKDPLFIPLMVISSVLFICTIAMISGICYYFICWKRKPRFEMLENEKLTADIGPTTETGNEMINVNVNVNDDDEDTGDGADFNDTGSTGDANDDDLNNSHDHENETGRKTDEDGRDSL